MSHTILLIQRSSNQNSRTYRDYPSVPEAISGLVELYEEKLKKSHTSGQLNYTLADLEAYVDGAADMSALVCNNKEGTYAPYGKDWIKKCLATHIVKLAKKSSKE